MREFIDWAHEFYTACLILSFAFVLLEIFIAERAMNKPSAFWRGLLMLSGWPLLMAVVFIFAAAGVWVYSWLELMV